MTQPPMTNEQFALWIASIKYSNSSDVIRIADKYYEWLKSKHKEPGYDIFEAMQAKKPKNEEQMKSNIKQVAKQAALALVFENINKIPMVEITIAAKGKQPNYNIKVPKVFLEEVYAMGVKNGFEIYIESGAIRQMIIEITK